MIILLFAGDVKTAIMIRITQETTKRKSMCEPVVSADHFFFQTAIFILFSGENFFQSFFKKYKY